MLLIVFLLPAVVSINVNPRKLTGKQLVDYVNRNAKWRATTRRIDANATNLLAGVKLDFPRVLALDQRYKPKIFLKKIQRNVRLPRWFDARHGWSYCRDQIDKIQDQSLCGSCWAVSSASSLQDRFCIWSRGSIQPDLSAIDLVSCCTECGEGCTGGYPHRVFEYAEKQGIVSGGNFTNKNGCKPYPFANCQNGHGDFSGPQCKGGNKEDVCIRTCQTPFPFNYYTDRYFTTGSVVIQNNPTAIQQELYRSGPLVFGAMQIFEDFLHYRSGVYEVTAGKFIGLHAVRLVGYGVENNIPYWLVANSWGRSWGQNGYFKIRRGNNEANIEGISSAGFPDFGRSSPAFDHL
ncbi:Secreted C13 protease-like protein [Aphelenchoides besseyi]|nr:Secreted C13 protease-like protein [Aphelenchoides besseyi]KAI6198452.1 Secreted C13 protease-like protein [Aphelenchoides besseyi]